MNDKKDRRFIGSHLKAIGYSVEELKDSEGGKEIADFWAHKESESFVIELKTKIEDEILAAELRASPPGTVVGSQSSLTRRNRLSGIVRKAASQIRTTKEEYSGLGLLWFRPNPWLEFADAPDQMEATLLGRRHVLFYRSGRLECVVCYLATHTDFHRYLAIDAAVIEYEGGVAKLLVNPYASKLDELRNSRLYKYFAQRNAMIDLDHSPKQNSVLVLHGDFDRADEAEVLKRIEKLRPGWKCRFVDMQSCTGHLQIEESPE